MRLGVVIPCHRQERFLPRTLAALDRALAGREWSGVLVLSSSDADARAFTVPSGWRVVRAVGGAQSRPLTPGAARNAGFEACGGDWVLFVDADVEVERAWLDRACEQAERDGSLAGSWGRIEEWFVDGAVERPGVPDLYRVGDGDGEARYTATLSFYRRTALAEVGGYDARLNSEEDFELGLRLRQAGYRLRTFAPLAARHWSAPRPSLSEVGRRWRTGLCFGSGQALRLYLGRAGFGELFMRNLHYVAVLAYAALTPFVAALGGAEVLRSWLKLPFAVLLVMALRKRSPRLALHSLVTWSVMAAGLVVGLVRGPAAPPSPVREAA